MTKERSTRHLRAVGTAILVTLLAIVASLMATARVAYADDEGQPSATAIARVSSDNGMTWVEFDYLQTTGESQGAFDYVKTLSGNVIVELLKETDDRYTLTSGISYGNGTSTFGSEANPAIPSLTIRSANPAAPATLVKNHTAPLLVMNIMSCQTTIDDIIVDGNGQITTGNGGAFQFASNTANAGNGSALPTATLHNVQFLGCQSTGTGGAVYSACPIAMENCLFDSCRASSNGGAVCAGTTATIINGARFRNCYSGAAGGAVYATTSITIAMNDSTGMLLFDTCSAAGDGGVFRSPTVTMDDNRGTVVFSGCYTANSDSEGGVAQTTSLFSAVNNQGSILFTGCHTEGNSSEGAALFGSGGMITLKSMGSGTLRFENMTANAYDGGGAICGWGGTVVTIEGTVEHPVEFENCTAKNSREARGGGAVYINTGSGNLKYVNANNCKSKYGGAFAASSSMTLTNCQIANCTQNESGATITAGGAIHVAGGTTTLNNCTIVGCEATRGGAININAGTAIMNGGSVTTCQAANGAGVFASGGFTMNDSEVANNNATSAGTLQTNGNNGTLRFKGNVKVRNNTINGVSGHNVYLNSDRDNAFYVDGLSSDAEIYVFVTDDMQGKHGYSGRTFGSYTNEANLHHIINERYAGSDGTTPLVGETFTDFGGGRLIAWEGEDTVLTVVSSADGVTPVGAGARFELCRVAWDGSCVIWRGTTDTNGQIRIAWTTCEGALEGNSDGGGASFINGREYALRQLQTTNGYALPGGQWIIAATDASNGLQVSSTNQASRTNYTQPFAISGINLERNAWTIKNDTDIMTVNYDLNDGGTGATFGEAPQQTVSFPNTAIAIASETVYSTEPVWAGHDFLGWNTRQNGKDGTAYPKGTPLYRTKAESPSGTLTLYAQWAQAGAIARVSFDEGLTWTHYSALITGDYETLDGSEGTEHVDGAFDAAKARILSNTGTVIIETLCKEHPRYALGNSFEFTNGDRNSTTLIIRTMPSLGYKSKIVKNQTAGPIIHSNVRYHKLEIENIIFDGQGLESSGNGGAILQSNTATGGGVFLTNCEFIDLKVSGTGGAVSVAANGLTIKTTARSTTRLSGCSSGTAGGAVYSQPNVTVESGTNGNIEFEDCVAGTSGGAISSSGTVTLTNTGTGAMVFETCKANSGTGGAISTPSTWIANGNKGTITFSKCEATSDGGAVYAYSTSTSYMNTNAGTIQFLDCKTNGNNGGGAIRVQRAFSAENNAGSIIFSGCSATGNGGALSNAGYTFTLTNTGNGTLSFVDCYAKGNGGAIFANGGTLTLTASSAERPIMFKNCKAGWDGSTTVSGGNGGGVYSGTTTMEHVVFGVRDDPSKACTASSAGGAVFSAALTYKNESAEEMGFYYCEAGTSGGAIRASGAVALTNTGTGNMMFETCKANGGTGGAISTTSTWTANGNKGNITFNKCEATSDGGAVYSDTSSAAAMDNNTGSIQFLSCKATGGNGGAIRTQRTFNIQNNAGSVLFLGCSATGNGGALANAGYTFTLTNMNNGTLSFANCYANGNGGAIYTNGGNLTITGASAAHPVTFENCKAGWNGTAAVSGGNGGGVYSGSATMSHIVFGVKDEPAKACTASAAGGAVFSGALTYYSEASTEVGFYYCEAGTSGGAIRASGAVTLTNAGTGVMMFETCKANGGTGGAISATGTWYANGNKGIITFNKCEATTDGGAIYSDSSSATSMDSNAGIIQFVSCKAKGGNGGAIRSQRTCNAQSNAGSILFSGCSATGNGGAFYNTGYPSTLTNTGNGGLSFVDCYAAGDGGAIFVNGNTLTITGASATNPVTFVNCKAGWNGTAIVSGKNGGGTRSGTANLTNVTFGVEDDVSKGCTTTLYGGAVYASGSSTLQQVSAFGCSATEGAAVYVTSGLTTTFNGGRYTGNTASGTNGGAINTVANDDSGSHFDFGSNVYIYDNTVDASGNQKNVVLSITNRSSPIRTTTAGLGANAKVGIYVIGTASTNPYKDHGVADTNFGTFVSAANLNKFVNDRDTKLVGDAGTGQNICWSGNGIVKITDMQDHTLCKNTYGTLAVYGKLQTGLTAVPSSLYNSDGSLYSGAVKLKLLQDLDLAETSVTYNGSREMTLTTAGLDDTDGFPYIREEGDDPYGEYRKADWAYIKRNQTSTYLIRIYNGSANVHVEHLLIDGANISYTGTGSSGFYISSASSTEFRNMTFINMNGSNGSAIQGRSGIVYINASDGETTRFVHCSSTGDGGAVYGGTTHIGQSGNGQILFDDCSASTNGGAIWTDGDSVIQNAEFRDCRGGKAGGAIYRYGANKVCTVRGCTFDGHRSLSADTPNSSNGGAIYVYDGNMELYDSTFVDCTSSGVGGNLSFDAGMYDALTVEGCTFIGHDTLTTQDNAATEGGAIRINANDGITIRDSTFTGFSLSSSGSTGGAIWSEDPITLMQDVSFDGCTAAKGGAIYANSTLNLVATTGNTSTFSDCVGTTTGGAIFANNSLTITGSDAESVVFEDCHSESGAGGAIRMNTAGVTMSITNARFGAVDAFGNVDEDSGCSATTGGGALYYAGWNNASSNPELIGCQFYGCEATNNGGAFWMDANPSNLNVTDCVFKGCKALGTGSNGRGGAVYLSSGRNVTFTNTNIESCVANTDGGGVHANVGTSPQTVTLDGCHITGNVAQNDSSAVHSTAGSLTIKGDTSITGNRAYGTNGGAINLVTDKKVYFEGDVQISGNTGQDGSLHNVVLNQDTKATINTTANGLGDDATIGVYVTDAYYTQRGIKNREFGTYDTTDENLSAFTNDRQTLTGDIGDSPSSIAWATAYTLVLDPNGGEGTAITTVLSFFREYALGMPFTRKGDAHFSEWNTRKDGTGQSYYASDIVSQLTDEDGDTVTLYAQWENDPRYQIVFHPNGGTPLEPREVRSSTPLGLLPSTRRDGYTFVRWKCLEDGIEVPYDKNTPVTHDMHMYASWDKNIYITFDAAGGIVGEDVREMKPGTIGSLPQAFQPYETKLDYVFAGWFDEGGNAVTPTTTFEGNATLTAHWEVHARRLRFDTNGGLPGRDLYTGYQNDLETIKNFTITQEILDTLPEITNHGCTFDGWYTSRAGGTRVDVGDSIDLRYQEALHAHWIEGEKATVTFDSDGGGSFDPISVFKGDRIPNYPKPTKTGFTFAGWYDGETRYDVTTPIDDDVTLTAAWEARESITVTFDSNGGSAVAPRDAYAGDYFTPVPKPTKEGAVFVGWYDANERKYTARTMLTESVSLTARWTEIVEVVFDGNGIQQTKTVDAVLGTCIRNLPSMMRTGYEFAGWYDDPEGEGEALTNMTPIDGPRTYYAKWTLLPVTETVGDIAYEYSIVWTTSPSTTVSNLGDTLHYSVSEGDTSGTTAYAHFYFMVKDSGDKVIPEEDIQIRIPKYAFKSDTGGYVGTNNVVSVIPEYPNTRPNFSFSYKDMGDYYLLVNNEPAKGGTAIDIRITYTGNAYNRSQAELIDRDTGKFIQADGTLSDQPRRDPVEGRYGISVDADHDGTPDYEVEKSLFTEIYKTHVTPEYTLYYHSSSYDTNSNVFTAWNTSWGEQPDDADKYYYVKWVHGYYYGTGPSSGEFSTLSCEWEPDAYETVYQTDDYVVTRHLYSDLTNGRTTLYKAETTTGEWANGDLATERRTQAHGINFYVPEPTHTTSSASVTGLSGRKWREQTIYHAADQDILLDGSPISDGFQLDISGPSEGNLVQVGDTDLYKANEYTLVIHDGDPKDVRYGSSRIGNKKVRLGDNDYRFTQVHISLTNADGYYDEDGWHRIANTAYTSWPPVEVWLRRAGETEYYQYTDVYFTGSGSKSVALPDDTVGYELRHTTTYWSTQLRTSSSIQIMPTDHTQTVVQADYDRKINSVFYNEATFAATRNDTNETLMDVRSGTSFQIAKSKTGLRITKSAGNAHMDTFQGLESIPVQTKATQYNDAGLTKALYAGTFYELLPLGTYVNESSVYAIAQSQLDRNYMNVEFVSDWQGTGQTMMVVSVSVPETIKSSSITIGYDLMSTFEDIQSRGLSRYMPSAFVNTSRKKEPYELAKSQKLGDIVNGSLLYGEFETEHGDYVAYASVTGRFKDINAFTLGFAKMVFAASEYAEETETIPNTEYTYRLTYSQSEYAMSDHIVFYDFLETGVHRDTDSEYRMSEWQGELVDVDVAGIAKATSEGKTCAPKVYYSTLVRGEILDSDYDLSSGDWTDERPDTGITAVAVDCSQATDGTEFVLKGQRNLVAYLTMLSPADPATIGKHTVNEAEYVADVCSSVASGDKEHVMGYSSVNILMRDTDPDIGISSVIPSGTSGSPALVAYKDTVSYDIAITNNDDTFTYRNLLIDDILPGDVSSRRGDIFVYTTSKEETIPIIDSSRASISPDSDGSHYRFIVHELLPGETLHIIVPTIVETTEGVFTDKATLLSVNTLPKVKETDTTWHEVRKYPIGLIKRILGTDAPLAGAGMELLNSSGVQEDEWVSEAEPHQIRLGAGDYTLNETDAPQDYAVAEPILFEVTRDGRVLVGGHEQDSLEVVMHDKYVAVDTVISNTVGGEDADLTKPFEYTVTMTGLRPSTTYHAGDTTFTSSRMGRAEISFTLMHDESITLSKLPSDAILTITQRGTEYDASYQVSCDGNVESRGETYLQSQDLVTREVVLDIDTGVRHIDFTNTLNNGISVRFIVLDDETGEPITGSEMMVEDAQSGDVVGFWTTTDTYKAIRLAPDGSYLLTQISVPDLYLCLQDPISLTMVGGILTSDANVVTGDAQSGFIVTIRNTQRAYVNVQNFGTDTEYFLAGASLEVQQDDTTYHSWMSGNEMAELIYLAPGDYTLVKTQAAPGYEAKRPNSVTIHVSDSNEVSVDNQNVYSDRTITLYDAPRMIIPTSIIVHFEAISVIATMVLASFLLAKRKWQEGQE